ncbi:tail assembly chaperone [Caldifermentibacillus hisashii]|uniref:tail assembly chaperone n=1 Tax=Caldifermentibacillus hisashii TaxID=996558 RepID=UPI001C120888|nr:tail assembly chaperone [Caldifermentibacillus hisashii]MBU5341305.1 tail assembly chaperone [Caldifermentibacillus hisashii]
METFEINGKEYELKLTFKAVRHLNGLYEGGAYALIGKAIMGDLDAFVNIVHAALLHTGENFKLKDIETAIEQLYEAEKLDQDSVTKICNEVVVNSFFYKKTVDKLLKDNPQAKKALETLTA